MCAVCPWAIEADETGKWTGKDTDTLEEELKDDIVHKDFMETCIELYEKKKREGGGKRVASTAARANAGVQVVATQYQDLEYSKCIGVLWPSALHKNNVGKSPSSRKTQTHIIEGRKVRGILLPKSQGT